MKPNFLLVTMSLGLGIILFLARPPQAKADSPPDAVFGNSRQPNQVCLGNGLGNLSCSDFSQTENTSRRLALGDVNGDRRPDVVIANIGQADRVCLGDSLGGFTCANVATEIYNSYAVALGDMNGDGHLDAVFGNFLSQRNRLCLGDGTGSFTCKNLSSDLSNSFGVALGYVDGDGSLDAVFANVLQRNRVCLGNGSGGFNCSDVSPDPYRDSNGVALGYLDGDLNLDAVFANSGQSNRVCLGDGLGAFSCSDVSPDTYNSFGVALGHVDGDGHLDAVFGNLTLRNRVCLGDGAGSFTCNDVSLDARSTGDVALDDLDGDTRLDAVFANGNQPNQLCTGDGAGTFTCSDIGSGAVNSFGVALGDVNPPILDLTKIVDWDTPLPGQLLTYTISISNSGGISATNAIVSDTVPAGLNFIGPVNIAGSGGSPGSPPTLATGLTIMPSSTITVSFPVTIDTGLPDGTVLTNTASITSLETSTAVTGTEVLTSRVLDLAATKSNTTGDGTILQGDSFTWTLTLSNGGPEAARFIDGQTILTDNLPNSGVIYGSPTLMNPVNVTNSASISCTLANYDLNCAAHVMTVTLGAPTAQFQLTIPVTTVAAGVLQNPRNGGVCAIDPQGLINESDEANNLCPDSVVVRSIADLAMTKTGSLTATPGLTTSYSLLVQNTGPGFAANAIISDTLTQFDSVDWDCTPSGGASCPASGTDSINHTVNLPAGSMLTYSVSGLVPNAATGQLVNTASVTPLVAFDPDVGNNTMSISTTLVPAADLAIIKHKERNNTAVPDPVMTYTVSVNNLGPSAANDAIVSDTIPAGAFIGDDWIWGCTGSNGASCNSANGTGSVNEVIPVLPAGGVVTYTIVGSLVNEGISVSNTAAVSSPSGVSDPVTSNNVMVNNDRTIYVPIIYKAGS